jgi:hypothetical protein
MLGESSIPMTSSETLEERRRQLREYLDRKSGEASKLEGLIAGLNDSRKAWTSHGEEHCLFDRLSYLSTYRLPAVQAERNKAATILALLDAQHQTR